MKVLRRVSSGLAALLIAGCGAIAVHTAPAKVATVDRSEAAKSADALFWETLHSGNYDGIDTALQAVTAAYLKDPNDAVTAAHVGWLHIWRLAENQRRANVPATITDDATLAQRYFQEAVTIDPSDARYLGFLASSQLAEGNIHHDEKLTRRGYYNLLDAIDAWPEFNLFTAGYVMSNLPADSPRFREGLEWQWKTLDLCANVTLDRRHPDFAPYMSLATSQGHQRVCWNSAIAPHNFEGFFLNMGDMLVKAGDWQTATTIYAQARLSPNYGQWAYAPVLESHLANAQRNVSDFNLPAGSRAASTEKIMFNSPHACVACHQR